MYVLNSPRNLRREVDQGPKFLIFEILISDILSRMRSRRLWMN